MKFLHFSLAALFLWITVVQFNDPDPLYWIVVYGGTALVAFAKGLGRVNEFGTTLLIGAVAAGMIIAVPGVTDYFAAADFGSIFGDMRGPTYVERTREFFGLMFALVLLLAYLRRQPSKTIDRS